MTTQQNETTPNAETTQWETMTVQKTFIIN